jgi:hypothetical protein
MKYETKRWTKPIQTSEINNNSLMIDLLEEPLDNSWKLKAKRLQARRWRKLRHSSS